MSVFECNHSNAWAGLDGCYCPDCQQTFSSGTKTYEQILKNTSRSRTREDTGPGVANNAKNSRGLDVGDRVCDPEPQPIHEHNWQSTTWTSDSKAIRVCRCGATEEISDESTLRKLLENLERLRQELIDLAEQSRPARAKELMRGVKDKDRQIAWVKGKLEAARSYFEESFGASPSQHENSAERSSSEKSSDSSSYLALDEIRRDGGTQPRAAIDLKHVKLLEEQMEDGKELEPIAVFYDGESHWLADGYHRWHAHRNQGREEIACIITHGSCREAILFSVGANADNKPALPRNREDKRRAVLTLIQDPEWGKWSDREIARQCKVSDKTVASLRKSICGNSADTNLNTERKVQRKGKTYTVNTTNIGRKASAQMEKLQDSDRRTEPGDHPLFPDRSGKITQLSIPDSATVELDTGERRLKPSVAPNLKLNEGGLVEVYAPENNKIDGRRGRIASVAERTVDVWLRDMDTMIMQKHTLKHQQVTSLPLKQEPQLKQLCDRLTKLREHGLDPFEVEIVNLLERTVVLTPTELEYLAHIEQRHGITQSQ